MTNHNAQNERLKRSYFVYLKEAKRHDDSTLDGVAKAIHRFESYTKFKDFRSFRIEQAVGFKHHLAELANQRTGKPLSKATLHQTLNALKNLFRWLAGRPGFRSRLSYQDADYFNLSEKEARIATAHRQGAIPTLEQIHFTLRAIPSGTDIEKRNRALVAFTILTGTRDGATASLKLRHIDISDGKIFQDARDVNTKFSKTFSTWFFPVGGDSSKRKGFGAWLIPCFRQPKSSTVTIGPLKRLGSTGDLGPMLARSAQYSRRLLLLPDCLPSIRTVSGKPW
jgi:integrase/recombinase XerD